MAARLESPEAFARWLKQSVGQREVQRMAGKFANDSAFFYHDDLIDVNLARGAMDFGEFVDTIMRPASGEMQKSLYSQGT